MTTPTLEVPIKVTGMDEFRAAVAEIKAGAADLIDCGVGVIVNIYVGNDPPSISRLAEQVRVLQMNQSRSGLYQ